MVLRTLANFAVAKRIPLIKFRKGGNPPPAGGGAASATKQASASSPVAARKKSTAPAIEDWQLPPRYWRKQIDVSEMEYINRGGPA